jgi:hypothetical protein
LRRRTSKRTKRQFTSMIPVKGKAFQKKIRARTHHGTRKNWFYSP